MPNAPRRSERSKPSGGVRRDPSPRRRGPSGRRARRGGLWSPTALGGWAVLILTAVAVALVRLHVIDVTGPPSRPPDDPRATLAAELATAEGAEPSSPSPPARSLPELRSMIRRLPAGVSVAEGNGYSLTGAPFLPAASPPGPFSRAEASGLLPPPASPWYEVMQPGVNEFAPAAAGDVSGYGWPDLVVGTARGVQLYINLGGTYALAQLDLGEVSEWLVTSVALVDLDGDSRPDLFVCGWRHGCRIFWNQDGSYSPSAATSLQPTGGLAVHAVGFGDVLHRGRVDVVTGSSTAMEWNFAPSSTAVTMWRNDGDRRFTPEVLPGTPGEMLTLLLSDLGGTRSPDLYAGADFDEPDRLYLNGAGGLKLATKNDSPVPYTTTSTMSADSGDIRNDGTLALFLTQIAYSGAATQQPGAQELSPGVACRTIKDTAEAARCLAIADYQEAVVTGRDHTGPGECNHLADPVARRDCVVDAYYWIQAFVELPGKGASSDVVRAACDRVPAAAATVRDVCDLARTSRLDYSQAEKEHPLDLPQHRDTNLLFVRDGARFRDVTQAAGVAFGGWSWNGRFVDLDNDTWQDLFITQGTRLRFSNPSNLFYRNRGDGTFADATLAAGLIDHVPTGGSVFVDSGMTGRLDIVAVPFQLTPVLWRNGTANPGLQVALRDDRSANRDGIGARVEIRSRDGRLQVREIKQSGGFESIDMPVARFGLGDWGSVASMKVTWPDGEVQNLSGLALEPGRYTLARR